MALVPGPAARPLRQTPKLWTVRSRLHRRYSQGANALSKAISEFCPLITILHISRSSQKSNVNFEVAQCVVCVRKSFAFEKRYTNFVLQDYLIAVLEPRGWYGSAASPGSRPASPAMSLRTRMNTNKFLRFAVSRRCGRGLSKGRKTRTECI